MIQEADDNNAYKNLQFQVKYHGCSVLSLLYIAYFFVSEFNVIFPYLCFDFKQPKFFWIAGNREILIQAL